MSRRGRDIPGTWPLLVSILVVLLLAPAAFLVQVLPGLPGALVALALTAAGLYGFCWSCVAYYRERRTDNRGIPMAGIGIGAIAAAVSAGVLIPLALG